jgi:hypothetical protein
MCAGDGGASSGVLFAEHAKQFRQCQRKWSTNRVSRDIGPASGDRTLIGILPSISHRKHVATIPTDTGDARARWPMLAHGAQQGAMLENKRTRRPFWIITRTAISLHNASFAAPVPWRLQNCLEERRESSGATTTKLNGKISMPNSGNCSQLATPRDPGCDLAGLRKHDPG